MGVMSKAFLKLCDTETRPVEKAAPLGALPSRNFGGLVKARSSQLPDRPSRCSAGELGRISRAKDAKGHGSEKRDGYAYSNPDASNGKGPWEGKPNGFSRETHRVHFEAPAGHTTYQDHYSKQDADKASMDGWERKHTEVGTTTLNRRGANDASLDFVPNAQTFGKSLSVFGLMQGLAKAKDAKGHGSEKRGGSGGGDAPTGSHVVQDAENGPVHFVKDPQDGYVSAVWPNTVADNSGNIQSFDPQGGHGAASKEWFKTQVPASREEAQKVHDQLTSAYGYKLSPLGSGTGKQFNTQQNIGRAKYVTNYHDGEKTHGDGSPFFDIHIAHNKPDHEKFNKQLREKGYTEK